MAEESLLWLLSCDVIIAISGGSGTLTEIAIAYQAGIPIIVVDKFEGWSRKLANQYLDDRKRLICKGVKTEEDALKWAIEEGMRKYENNEC